MFKSTTLRLTGWYLLILMFLSVAFSIFVYQIANNEVHMRLERFQSNLQDDEAQNFIPPPITAEVLRANEQEKAASNLSSELLYINICVLAVGGFASYFLARRSLKPIEKAHEAQSRFTSDASHELRTPLAVMKTELEVALSDDKATAQDLKSILSSNLEEVDKLSKLSEMLLNLSRLDSTKLKITAVNLNKVASNVIGSFKQPKERIKFVSNKQLTVNGNEIALIDLVRVLIDNALLYSPSDSQVKVSIEKQDKNAVLIVSNTGPGIASEKLPNIFERFYRADSSRTNSEHKGYGLGLALAKSIADLHKGSITASSSSDETSFSLFVPLYSRTQAKSKL